INSRALERIIADGYRQKSERIGCENGLPYLQAGMVESYGELGALLALVNAYQGGTETQSAFSKLTPVEQGLISAFRNAAVHMFGATYSSFEADLVTRATNLQ